jgi:hypothetical protein
MNPLPPLLVIAEGRKPRARRAPRVRPKEIELHVTVAHLLRDTDQLQHDARPNQAAAARAALCARHPAEFEAGYRFGLTGEPRPPCDAAGYPIGFHTWELGRRNAWWAGWNLGHVERDDG